MVDGLGTFNIQLFFTPGARFLTNFFWSVNVVGCLFSSVDGQVGRCACPGGGGGGDLIGGQVVGE